MELNEKNWTTVYPDKYNLLPKNTKLLIDDIENTFLENVSVNDALLMALFEELKIKWSSKIEPSVLHNTIEVSKSSFVFWRKNFSKIDFYIQTRVDEKRPIRWRALGKLALGDATGAAWGSIGGPGGALLGGVGGTLGATISGSIFGFD